MVANLDRIRRATAACVSPSTTPAKTHGPVPAAVGARAAIDTELELTATDDRVTLKVTEAEGRRRSRAMRLALIPAAESCVLVPSGHVTPTDETPAGVVETLDAAPGRRGPRRHRPRRLARRGRQAQDHLHRHRAQLVARGMVRNVGTEKQHRYVVADDDEGDQ